MKTLLLMNGQKEEKHSNVISGELNEIEPYTESLYNLS